MQRAIATDGVEWDASDMTFDQDGRDNEIKQRTIVHLGAAGVAEGGAISAVSGTTIAISGPLKFTVNGLLGIISAPANIGLGNNDTWYIIAKYQTTDSTPATYYGSGAPPNKRRSVTPVIVARNLAGGGAANSGANEVNLGTVTTGAGTITNITDLRIVVPRVSNGSILMGAGATIDGVDPSAHVAQIATNSVPGHVLLGAPGGAARYEDVAEAAGYWVREAYIYGRSSGFIPNLSDFQSPPGGVTMVQTRVLTQDGHFWMEGNGPEWNIMAGLDFSSTAAFTATAYVLAVDDTIRVKLNGTDVYTRSGASVNLNAAVSLPIIAGINQLQIFFANGGGDRYVFQFLTDILRDNRITFLPS